MGEKKDAIEVGTWLEVNPDIVLREEEDNYGILYNPDLGTVYIMNATATALWKQLEKGSSVQKAFEVISQEFENIDETALSQLLSTANELLQLDAVVKK